jgi:hypothetical protein
MHVSSSLLKDLRPLFLENQPARVITLCSNDLAVQPARGGGEGHMVLNPESHFEGINKTEIQSLRNTCELYETRGKKQ